MRIPNNNHMYGEWPEAVKDEMLEIGFGQIGRFPDHHFRQIIAGMWALLPACEGHVTVSAANNWARMVQMNQAVLQLVKHCGVRLRTMVKNRSTGLAPMGQNGIFPDPIMRRDRLLPSHSSDQ